MKDPIERADAIAALDDEITIIGVTNVFVVKDYVKRVLRKLRDLPSAQSTTDEWCTDCKEYDSEKHCCPRWNRVIRQTLEEAQPQRTRGYERVVYCGECAHMMPDGRCREFADDNIRPSAFDYCSAGEKRADMRGGEQNE